MRLGLGVCHFRRGRGGLRQASSGLDLAPLPLKTRSERRFQWPQLQGRPRFREEQRHGLIFFQHTCDLRDKVAKSQRTQMIYTGLHRFTQVLHSLHCVFRVGRGIQKPLFDASCL